MLSKCAKVGIMLILICSLAGCGVPATPLDTIKPPKSDLSAHNYTTNQEIMELLPDRVQLVTPIMGKVEDAIFFGDLNGDGIDEAIVVYENQKNRGNTLKAVLFRKENDVWKKVSEVNGFGYGLNYARFLDIDNDGHKELLLGWSLGDAGNGLDIYRLMEDQLHLLSNRVYVEHVDLEKTE